MQFLTADKLFDGRKFLDEKSVLVINDKKQLIEIIAENTIASDKIEKLNGIICPGFINAHCHTELSHLKNKIPQKTGLPGFGKQIILQRFASSKEEIKEHIKEADKEMLQNGIVAVGDICNTADSFETKADSKICYHSFIELLGLHPERAMPAFDAGRLLFEQLKNMELAGSLAPHAPYSTSNDLIEKISGFNLKHNLPSSIHNQESEDETKFFNGIKNGFSDLFAFLQVDISWFKAPLTSSIKYYSPFLSRQKTLLVHNVHTSKEDIEFVKQNNIYWCFCPNANLYIENKLPDLNLFSSQKNKICFGTDSLASNTQLDLMSEINVLSEKFPDFNMQDFLAAVTFNAAESLNQSDKFGHFILGKNAGLNLVELSDRKIKFIKKLT